MRDDFNPRDWYWIVGGDESQVFSSARNQYVSTDDADYQQFLIHGGAPTRIASQAELTEVLTRANVAPYLRVTPWQFRKALNQTGWRDAVAQLLANPDTPQDIKDGFEVASEVESYHPDIIAMGNAVGMTEADRIKVFELARTL